MISFLNTIKRNNESFYDYQTSDPNPIRWRISFFVFFSFIFATLFKPIETDVIGAILTVQSILMGFSFSVLFFLMSGVKNNSENGAPIEINNKIRRLNKLSKELFFNVSYFNFLAIFSVLISLLLLLPSIDMPVVLTYLKTLPFWDKLVAWDLFETLKKLAEAILFFINFCLYFVLIESLFTFFRTAGRVSFYFEKRLEVEDHE